MTEQNILKIFAKYEVEESYFRKNYKGFVVSVLLFCEKNQIKLAKPLFSRAGVSGNTYLHYYCECGEEACSLLTNFMKKTVFACKKCNAAQINKIFKPLSNDDVKKSIVKNGFKVVSTNNQGLLSDSNWTLRCAFNHEFNVSGSYVKNVKNCPLCYKSSMEEEVVRNLIEHHFQSEFPNTRPEWLVNPLTNKNLELDLYNKEKALAFEYHGPQHHLPIFGQERLEKSIRNDSYRRKICAQYGVRLIEIFHPKNTLNKEDFINYVSEKLTQSEIFISQESKNYALEKEVQCNKTGKVLDKIKERLKESNKKFEKCHYENAYSPVYYTCNICKSEHITSSSKLCSLTKNSCPTCVQNKKKEKAIIRHQKIVSEICKEFNFKFVDFLKTKSGQISGFKYENDQGQFLFGIKKYKRYIAQIKELN